MDKWKLGAVYFAVLGAVTLWLGCWELGRAFMIVRAFAPEWLKLSAEGMNWMCIWRGVVTFLSGSLIMLGAFRFSDTEGFGTSVIGTIMLWILGGCDILKMFCGSIASTWPTVTFYGFLKAYAPSYPAAIWLLPFSLVMIYFIVNWDKKEQKERKIVIGAKELLSSNEREETV